MTDTQHSTHAHPSPQSRLAALLWPERRDIGIVVFFSVIVGLLYLAVPLAVDAVVQNIAFGGEQQVYMQALLILSGALLVFLALMSVIGATQHYVAELIQQKIFVRLAADMAYRLPRLRMQTVEASKTPELVNRFLDLATLQKSAAMILLDGVNVVLSGAIGMLVLAFYHPSLLVFDAVLIAGLLLILFPLGRNGVDTSIQESYAKHAVVGWFEQLVMYPALFKSRGGGELALERADEMVNHYLTCRKSHYRILIRQIIGLFLLQTAASAGLLLVGGALVLGGELTLGQLVASELIVGSVVASAVGLGKHIEIWYDALAATDKLGSLVDLVTEDEDGEEIHLPEGPLELDFDQVAVGYDEARPVIHDLSLQVHPGEKVALTGPTGSGTGALLELAYGLRDPISGGALIGGLDVRQWSLEALRKRVTFVSDLEIFAGTVAENIRLGDRTITTPQVRKALEQVGLMECINNLPGGLDAELKVGGLPLSDSQKTKLCLARAIASQPGLLLIDKVLDGMSTEELHGIAQHLFSPEASWTLLIATRNTELLGGMDQVVTFPLQPTPTTHGKELAAAPVTEDQQ